MDGWVRFDQRKPNQGDFIAAVTQRDQPLAIEDWEADLELNAVGIWVDGEVWVGNTPFGGFTHWIALPDRPGPVVPSTQLSLWGFELGNPAEPH